MLWKIATLVVAIAALYAMLTRRRRRVIDDRASRPPRRSRPAARRAEELSQCPRCGEWRAPGADCSCSGAPTP